MKKKEPEFIVLEVTLTRKYFFEKGEINGWSTDQVIEDWFTRHPLGNCHATRDYHAVGGSDRMVKVRQIQIKDIEGK